MSRKPLLLWNCQIGHIPLRDCPMFIELPKYLVVISKLLGKLRFLIAYAHLSSERHVWQMVRD